MEEGRGRGREGGGGREAKSECDWISEVTVWEGLFSDNWRQS